MLWYINVRKIQTQFQKKNITRQKVLSRAASSLIDLFSFNPSLQITCILLMSINEGNCINQLLKCNSKKMNDGFKTWTTCPKSMFEISDPNATDWTNQLCFFIDTSIAAVVAIAYIRSSRLHKAITSLILSKNKKCTHQKRQHPK